MLSCVFATPSNARPDPQSTVGAVTQFCGDRVCPAYLLTTPKVVERRTVRRHQRVARAVLPKARPLDANGNPGRGLVTVETRQPFSLRRPLYDKLRNRAFESETGASICRTFVAEAVFTSWSNQEVGGSRFSDAVPRPGACSVRKNHLPDIAECVSGFLQCCLDYFDHRFRVERARRAYHQARWPCCSRAKFINSLFQNVRFGVGYNLHVVRQASES